MSKNQKPAEWMRKAAKTWWNRPGPIDCDPKWLLLAETIAAHAPKPSLAAEEALGKASVQIDDLFGRFCCECRKGNIPNDMLEKETPPILRELVEQAIDAELGRSITVERHLKLVDERDDRHGEKVAFLESKPAEWMRDAGEYIVGYFQVFLQSGFVRKDGSPVPATAEEITLSIAEHAPVPYGGPSVDGSEKPAEWMREAETELGTVFALVHKAAYINDKRTPADIIAAHVPNRRVHDFLDEMGVATNNPRAKLYHRVEKLFEMYQEELAFHAAHAPVDGRPLLFHHPQPLLCANCNDELDGDEDAYCGGCVPPGTFEPAPQSGLSVEEAAERTGRDIALRYGYIGGEEDVGLIKQAINAVAGPLREQLERCDRMIADNGRLKAEVKRLQEKVTFQTISAEPCPECGKQVSWMLCETGTEAFCKCGWTSLDGNGKERE